MKSGENGKDLQQGIVIETEDIGKTFCIYAPEAQRLNGFSCVVVSLFGKSTESHQEYLVPFGSEMIRIVDDLLEKKTPRLIRLEMKDYHAKTNNCDEPVSKGSITINIESVKTDIPKQKQSNHPTRDEIDAGLRRMEQYAVRTMYMFESPEDEANFGSIKPHYRTSKYTPTNPGLARIHCPIFKMDNGFRLPGAAYTMIMPRTPQNETYLSKLVRTALMVYEVNEKTFIESINTQLKRTDDYISKDFRMSMNVIGGACALFALGQLYIPDHVNKYVSDGVSDFSDCCIEYDENMSCFRVTRGNDCEDANQVRSYRFY